jgi:hypothetical protein
MLVEFYDQFLGDGGIVIEHGLESKQAPWRFWPGGWHAGQGWWEDVGVDYSLEVKGGGVDVGMVGVDSGVGVGVGGGS